MTLLGNQRPLQNYFKPVFLDCAEYRFRRLANGVFGCAESVTYGYAKHHGASQARGGARPQIQVNSVMHAVKAPLTQSAQVAPGLALREPAEN